MYILQERIFGNWNDFYIHNDYSYLFDVMKVFQLKYPNREYRVIEVIECV